MDLDFVLGFSILRSLICFPLFIMNFITKICLLSIFITWNWFIYWTFFFDETHMKVFSENDHHLIHILLV